MLHHIESFSREKKQSYIMKNIYCHQILLYISTSTTKEEVAASNY